MPDENDLEGDVTLPEELDWLIDVPMFIDSVRIQELHDVVSEPLEDPFVSRPTGSQSTEAEGTERESGVEGGGGVNIPSLFDISLKASNRVIDSETAEEAISYSVATTPPRQLAQVTLRYLVADEDYIHINKKPENDDWTESSTAPRPLVFLELPGQGEIDSNVDTDNKCLSELREMPVETKLVPTAAEFDDGTVVPIYKRLDTDQEKPPKYPELDENYTYQGDDEPTSINDRNLDDARRDYWNWFKDNFQPKKTTRVVEEVAGEYGDIRWIDFRLPRNQAGDTLHLHIQPREKYNTGTFAYNFIKRGYKHGLRMVGTIKSEPDMDVLAIYER